MRETHNLNESDDKITLKTKLCRGSEKRDQDTHEIKVRANTPEEAAENLEIVLSELKMRGVFAESRQVGNNE